MDKNTIYGEDGFETKTLTLLAPKNMSPKFIDSEADAIIYDLVAYSLSAPTKTVEFTMLPKPMFPKGKHNRAYLKDTKERTRLIRLVLSREYSKMLWSKYPKYYGMIYG